MKAVVRSAGQLYESGRRLDASYHASEGVKALCLIRQWARHAAQPATSVSAVLRDGTLGYGGKRVESLKDVCVPEGVFIPGRFKRFYVDDPEQGEPWLSPSDMLKADLSGLRLVSRKLTPNIETLRIRQDWMLLSRSGTIGNLAYVREDMDGLIGSDDIIRIVADPTRILPGYLYTFLSSPLGKALIEQKTYGAVVPHIEAHHVIDLPIPRLDPATEQRIHELVERAAALRVEANHLLNTVGNNLLRSLDSLPYIPRRANLGFLAPISELVRLKAFNNKPATVAARSVIAESREWATLGEVTERIFHPFRMNMIYVDKDHGVPFLNLADIMANRYRTTNFMSSLTANFPDYLLEYGWTLVSRDGTIGKVSFVGRYLEGTAVNQHISRLVPDVSVVPPGYLYAFMASPYAQLQIDSLVYGSVVQGIYEQDVTDILMPLLPELEMQAISQGVELAFQKRYQAIQAEDKAQKLLLEALRYN